MDCCVNNLSLCALGRVMAALLIAFALTHATAGSFAAPEETTTGSAGMTGFIQESYPLYNLVVAYNAADKKWVEDVVARVDQARRELNRIMPDALLAQIRVVVAPTKEAFLRLAGGWAEHSVAVAQRTRPQPTVIVNAESLRTAAPAEISKTLLHELVHCYVGLRFKSSPPRWFEEGVATIAADGWSMEDAAAVGLAAVLNRLIPLRELERHFPSTAERQRLAYQQSASVVRFMMTEQNATLSKFLAPYTAPESERLVAELWNPVYVEPLELRWKKSLRSWRAWVITIGNSGMFWGIVAALTILAWYLKKRRNAERRREWEEEERIYESLDDEENDGSEVEDDLDDDEKPRPPWYG